MAEGEKLEKEQVRERMVDTSKGDNACPKLIWDQKLYDSLTTL